MLKYLVVIVVNNISHQIKPINQIVEPLTIDEIDKQIAEAQKEFSDAVYKDSCIRESAILGIDLNICGVPVKQLTPYHYILLDFINSPFLQNGEVNISNIVDVLWIISTEFKANDKEAKTKFIETKCVDIVFDDAINNILKYIANTFIDIPASVRSLDQAKINKVNIPHVSWVVSYVDTLAKEYGWFYTDVIHMPFALIFQFLKTIEIRESIKNTGKQPDLVNGTSDAIKRKIIRLTFERNKILKEKENERNN